MARGNDSEAAARELKERYGEGAGNAEDVIRSAAAAQPPALKRASLKPVDAEASADLDLDAVGKKAGINGTVIDAAVRGGDVVYVYVDEGGHAVHKGVLVEGKDSPDVEDGHLERIRKLQKESEKARKRAAKKDDEEPEQTPAEKKAAKEAAEAARQVNKTSSLRAKAREGETVEDEIEKADK